MTAVDFIQFVKAKLNRLDSSAYEDIRPEEVLLYANDALKALVLKFDQFRHSTYSDKPNILTYLAQITKSNEANLVNNKVALPTILKFKDVEVFVTVGTRSGWMETREYDNNRASERKGNPFLKSYPDSPVYRLINDEILFETDSSFNCTKVKYDYLELPQEITLGSTIDYTFIPELQNETVTLLLETLESRRLASQPVTSKS